MPPNLASFISAAATITGVAGILVLESLLARDILQAQGFFRPKICLHHPGYTPKAG